MAYSGIDLITEIRKLIDEKLECGETVQAAWIATEVTSRHENIDGEDADFHFFCTGHYVRQQVRRALKHYDCSVDKASDPQLVLPGYECLQRAYAVTREEQQVIVPIDNLSDPEIEAKAAELENMAAGALKHADELRRYVRNRQLAA